MNVPLSSSQTPLTVEPFRGTTRELQQFVFQTWSSAYQGKMSFPVWSEKYFDWQLPDPKRRLAAYGGDRLVGVLLGSPYPFQTTSESFAGSHWSWLSVDAEMKGRNVAKLLDAARRDVELSQQSELVVSYRFAGSRHSLAERPNKNSPLKHFHQKLGFWARPIDGTKLQRWNVNPVEGWLSRGVVSFLPKRLNSKLSKCVRAYKPDDLEQCLEVIQKETSGDVLSIGWDNTTLRHHLEGSELSQTHVAEVNGVVQGFFNFHVLDFIGRTQEPVAVVDLIACRALPSKLQRQLVLSALQDMREQGVILALKLNCGDAPSGVMYSTGFFPRLPDSYLVLQWTSQLRAIPTRKPMNVLWR